MNFLEIIERDVSENTASRDILVNTRALLELIKEFKKLDDHDRLYHIHAHNKGQVRDILRQAMHALFKDNIENIDGALLTIMDMAHAAGSKSMKERQTYNLLNVSKRP